MMSRVSFSGKEVNTRLICTCGLFPFLIPGSEKILYFFFGCRADGRHVLIVRFAAVWATVGQRLCLKAVMAGIAEIVGHSACTSNLRDVYVSSGYFSILR